MRAVMTGTPMSMVNLPSTSSTTVTPPAPEPAAAEPAPAAAPAADPAADDGAAPRDVVDYMYMGLRVALIMVTVVMYSSMMRVAGESSH
jgi:predicted cobalt transporter CbtA